jgi:hypothetical protein
VNEVEALYELFKRVSNSLVKDGLIHKEEFCLALFKSQRENLFANRVRNGPPPTPRPMPPRARSARTLAQRRRTGDAVAMRQEACGWLQLRGGAAAGARCGRPSVGGRDLTPPAAPWRLRAQVFEIFDEKKNNVIEFGEFVHALSVFHPKAPVAEKAECAWARFVAHGVGAAHCVASQA